MLKSDCANSHAQIRSNGNIVKLRLPKLIAVMLALASCASGGIASFAACQHAARVAAHDTAHDATRHDCCHAHLDKHTARTDHATRAGDVARTGDATCNDAARVEPTGDDGSTLASCCDGLATRTSAPAVAATNDTSRTRFSHVVSARTPTPAAPLLRTANAPPQHAPPVPATRLHILISVLLI